VHNNFSFFVDTVTGGLEEGQLGGLAAWPAAPAAPAAAPAPFDAILPTAGGQAGRKGIGGRKGDWKGVQGSGWAGAWAGGRERGLPETPWESPGAPAGPSGGRPDGLNPPSSSLPAHALLVRIG
jgi:hypothetical protein